MSSWSNSTELHINCKDVPKWNPNKHFFDQSREVLQYWEEEFKKMTEGVNIGGYHMHPWLYTHLNHFVTPIPTKDSRGRTVDKIKNPPLSDLTLLLKESYADAELLNLALFFFGTRGATKTTELASLIFWLNSTKPNGVTSVVGGDDGDLKQISRTIQVAFDNAHPALYIPRITTDWDSEVKFGVKAGQSDPIIHGYINITNANRGNSGSSEKAAGLNPIGWIADEAGKYSVLKPYNAAKPSFFTQYGAKLVPILSGTGGNEKLSKDAQEMLTNPKKHGILPLDLEKLERNVPDHCKTWKRTAKKPFGTFIPGQMSYRLPVEKIESNLGDFLGINSPELKEVKLYKTDWEAATKKLEELIDKEKDMKKRNKDRMYYPRDTDDCFLTETNNPFPIKLIDRRIRELEDNDQTGKPIEIIRDGSKFTYEFSSKKRAEVSHPGGEADAPIVLFSSIPDEKPPKYFYVSGHDGYKTDLSDTDSLGSHYVIQRRNLEPNTPCETIKCSYSARPDTMGEFTKNCELITEAWYAECCMESVDMSFKNYLELKGKADDLLAPAFTFADNSSLRSRFGLFPTKGNNEYRMNLLFDWCKEQHVIGVDENGSEIVKYGVDFIDCIDLLREMKNYEPGGNYDRITAFSHALVYARELDKKNINPVMRGRGPNFFESAKNLAKLAKNPFGRSRNMKIKRY
jgi:hypothetical protein